MNHTLRMRSLCTDEFQSKRSLTCARETWNRRDGGYSVAVSVPHREPQIPCVTPRLADA